MKENFLSYLVIFVFCCQSPPLLSYNCFYVPTLIVRNRYRMYDIMNFSMELQGGYQEPALAEAL